MYRETNMSGEGSTSINISHEKMDQDWDSDGDDWSEEEDHAEPTKCLFCDQVLDSVQIAIEHIWTIHSIDLKQLKEKFQMDCYSYIKFINYIRLHKSRPSDIQQMTDSQWNDEKYLKPAEYEPWLTYDIESLEHSTTGPTQTPAANSDVAKLKAIVDRLQRELNEKNIMLQQAGEDMQKMQASIKNLIEKEPTVSEHTKCKPQELANSVASISLEKDDGYFVSYSHFGIHHDMLSDEVRTSSYRDALLGNSEFLKGKSVLDVGCGTSILSMFAAKAGAEPVVAIDNSDIIYQAMDIARTNKFENIKFVKGRLEDTELPVDKFDVIVSEWMGYFLVFEGMLDSIIYARDKHLKLGGTLMPNRCTISIVGHGDEKRHQDYIDFWKNVYDFDMSCMQKEVLREAMIEVVKPEHILTDINIIANYDLMRVDVNYSNFTYDFSLKVSKSGKLTSIVGYFDTFFDLPNKVSFSTGPETKPTHWKQVTFFIREPVDVKVGELINGKITCKRNVKDMRSLAVRIKIFDKEFNYKLD